ncbi:MAG: 3-deoxy-manno-octulosonate cytidylyltransferase [Ignavibacteria bacterium]|jgi:3-deoxy-manno-octulosonate cytidylyltransferase (CMP-KDO synthetase)|nr:3-deoxy-manno-octulosonate cytidylyltransferase [Ignavibacteria bacterium]
MNVIGIIPARYSSQRLPAKPLADICGVPMVVRVWQNVSNSKLMSKVVVATDDERIVAVCEQYNVPVVMTEPSLPSGTDRIYAAYQSLSTACDVVVNIQGDEPLLSSSDIDILLNGFCGSNADVGTLVTKITDSEEVVDPANVKVVVDKNMVAMYFSRSPIPFNRDVAIEEWHKTLTYWKHIGIYAYKVSALQQFVSLPQSTYEQCEKLEQLRLLEQGAKFLCVETNSKLISVDTAEDLSKVIATIQSIRLFVS